MKHVDIQYKELVETILRDGELRSTRSGNCYGIFDHKLKFDLREGFPAITTKKLALKPMVGENLWFVNGETNVAQLAYRTFGDYNRVNDTIWTPDLKRWKGNDICSSDTVVCEDNFNNFDLGPIYGDAWGKQLPEVIERIKNNPTDRRLIVNSWNYDKLDQMALPPCHYTFQFYCTTDGYLDLKWTQRSVDVGLGLPFNIASYALLLEFVASITGRTARYLIGDLGDVHIYENSILPLLDQLKRQPYKQMRLKRRFLPKTLEEIYNKEVTAKDFMGLFDNYKSHEKVKIDVKVG